MATVTPPHLSLPPHALVLPHQSAGEDVAHEVPAHLPVNVHGAEQGAGPGRLLAPPASQDHPPAPPLCTEGEDAGKDVIPAVPVSVT